MSDTPETDESRLGEVELALLARAPEMIIAPSLERITGLVGLLGDPQACAPVIHIAGTNGKTSTARIIDSLLRAFGLRTGLYTSPHLRHVRERIQIGGEPISPERFVAAYDEIAPCLPMIDAQFSHGRRVDRLSMFEVLTAMAFTAFADAPVDVMIIECGMGGRWDATNVVDAAVTVITPIHIDHTNYLGETIEQIAGEKAGILAAQTPAVFAHQVHEAAAILLSACRESGLSPAREGIEFGIGARALAVGGQQLTIDGLGGQYPDLFLPLHGVHQASNAAVALATVETFLGGGSRLLNEDSVRDGMAQVTSPGRIELVRSGPTVIVDAAHNPHGAHALAVALTESFSFDRVVGIVAAMEDKDHRGMLEAMEPVVDELIVTENSSPRSALAAELAETARAVFGDERVSVSSGVPQAVDDATERADELLGEWSVGIVAFGSVVTAADVRDYLRQGGQRQ